MPSFETGRRNMNLCSGLTYSVGDWTHFLKPHELDSIGLFFNTRDNFARPLSQTEQPYLWVTKRGLSFSWRAGTAEASCRSCRADDPAQGSAKGSR